MPPHRLDALQAITAREYFGRLQALAYCDHRFEGHRPRPLLFVDRETELRWVRVGELATFVRVVLGVSMSQSTLDGRLGAVGVERHLFAARAGERYARVPPVPAPGPFRARRGGRGGGPADRCRVASNT